MASLEQQIEQSLKELAATRTAVDEIRRRAAEASVTKRSKNRMVSVTVGARGELRGVTFHGDSYRTLAPAELARLVVETSDQARTECQSEMQALLDELLPGSTRSTHRSHFASESDDDDFDDMLKRFVRASGTDLSDDQLAGFDASWNATR